MFAGCNPIYINHPIIVVVPLPANPSKSSSGRSLSYTNTQPLPLPCTVGWMILILLANLHRPVRALRTCYQAQMACLHHHFREFQHVTPSPTLSSDFARSDATSKAMHTQRRFFPVRSAGHSEWKTLSARTQWTIKNILNKYV